MMKKIWLMLIRQTIIVLVKVYFNLVLLQFKKNIITAYNYNLIILLIIANSCQWLSLFTNFAWYFPAHLKNRKADVNNWVIDSIDWLTLMWPLSICWLSGFLRIIQFEDFNWHSEECYMWTLGVMWLYGNRG